MTSPTPAPAPLAYTPWEYTQSGRAEAWAKEKMLQMQGPRKLTLDFTGAVEAIGYKKAAQMMREEGN